MKHIWMFVRCVLETALVIIYVFRVPYLVRVCRYKLHHESLSYNAQWLLGTALALGTVALLAWDCHRTWRRLQRMTLLG